RVPMLPIVAGPAETQRQILRYSVILLPIGAAPWLLGYADVFYGVTAVLAGALVVVLAQRLRTAPEGRPARPASQRLFAFSILYLFGVFAAFLVEARLGGFLGVAG